MYSLNWTNPNQSREDELAAKRRERELDRRLDPDRDVVYIYKGNVFPADTKRQRNDILERARKRDTSTSKLDAVILRSVPRGEEIVITDKGHNAEFYDWLTV